MFGNLDKSERTPTIKIFNEGLNSSSSSSDQTPNKPLSKFAFSKSDTVEKTVGHLLEVVRKLDEENDILKKKILILLLT
jgi:hypothetical protein